MDLMSDGRLVLQKYHLALVQELERENLATTVMSRKLERLRDFEEIESFPLPKGFTGTLRPLSKSGVRLDEFPAAVPVWRVPGR